MVPLVTTKSVPNTVTFAPVTTDVQNSTPPPVIFTVLPALVYIPLVT